MTNYDIITVGGGLGGAAIAKVMAEHGATVLVLESETSFKDRIRGEVMMSCGRHRPGNLRMFEGGWWNRNRKWRTDSGLW